MEGPTPGLCRGQHHGESRWSYSKSRDNVCKRKVQLDYAAADAVCLLHLDNAKASCGVCCDTTCDLDSVLWRNFSQKAAALIAPWRQASIFWSLLTAQCCCACRRRPRRRRGTR